MEGNHNQRILGKCDTLNVRLDTHLNSHDRHLFQRQLNNLVLPCVYTPQRGGPRLHLELVTRNQRPIRADGVYTKVSAKPDGNTEEPLASFHDIGPGRGHIGSTPSHTALLVELTEE